MILKYSVFDRKYKINLDSKVIGIRGDNGTGKTLLAMDMIAKRDSMDTNGFSIEYFNCAKDADRLIEFLKNKNISNHIIILDDIGYDIELDLWDIINNSSNTYWIEIGHSNFVGVSSLYDYKVIKKEKGEFVLAPDFGDDGLI